MPTLYRLMLSATTATVAQRQLKRSAIARINRPCAIPCARGNARSDARGSRNRVRLNREQNKTSGIHIQNHRSTKRRDFIRMYS